MLNVKSTISYNKNQKKNKRVYKDITSQVLKRMIRVILNKFDK